MKFESFVKIEVQERGYRISSFENDKVCFRGGESETVFGCPCGDFIQCFFENTVSSVRVGGTNRNVVIVGEEALSDREIDIFGYIVDDYRKQSGTLKTSPWGTPF